VSRLAKKAIEIPKGVEVTLGKESIQVKGPKGTNALDLMKGIIVEKNDKGLLVSINEKQIKRQFLGLYRSLIKNLIEGVVRGFQKKLQILGIGYRAQMAGAFIELAVGYSHPRKLPVPQGIKVNIEKNTLITIEGVDKRIVGQFAADVRSMRKPEPYKGKGIRYEGEYVRKKAGKSAKTGA
jgi:large subunit ribosomal protein L6